MFQSSLFQYPYWQNNAIQQVAHVDHDKNVLYVNNTTILQNILSDGNKFIPKIFNESDLAQQQVLLINIQILKWNFRNSNWYICAKMEARCC